MGLWKACQHSRLGDGDRLERFTKICFRGCCETICTVTKKNLIHIYFKNLIFREQVLKLECE